MKRPQRHILTVITAMLFAAAAAMVMQRALAKPSDGPAIARPVPYTAPAAPTPAKLAVFPDKVTLTTRGDWKAIVVQATYPDGVTRDVTASARFLVADETLARVTSHVVAPVKDGDTRIDVSYAGLTVGVPVAVRQVAVERPISFRNDVLPVLTGSGCNTGGCHGASSGKDGFHLSLFGYDPEGDYQALTRQMVGRRINIGDPAKSLLLLKATGSVLHTGGERFKADSASYATVTRWLAAAAPNDAADLPRVASVRLMPTQMVLAGDKVTQRVVVIAGYSDGSERDVTGLATLFSSNETSATIDRAGLVTAHERGEAFVFARFDTFTVGSQVIVVPANSDFSWNNPPRFNYIDDLVDDKLKKLRVLPSDLCTDEEFLRRATIDIVGLTPTRAEHDAFLADSDPKKREKLVDALLSRKEFVELWVMKFAELLQIRSESNGQGISYKAAVLYYNWLQEQLANNVPMDQIVRELLSSSGGTFTTPATNYWQVERETLKLTENAAQVFMGVQIKCAQCHNHPFDRWTMDDYYGFMAFFTQIGRKQSEDPRETIVFNGGGGEAKHPVGGRVMPPKFLGGASPDLAGRDRRVVLAEWLTAPENPFFSKNLANIVWSHFFGRGIVHPVDDVRVTNPPSNPALLDELGKRFASYRYDFRKLVRDICTSRTYQLSTRTNATNEKDERNFSHAYLRRMRAEVLFDVISEVTNTAGANKFKGLPQGSRAVQIADGRTSTYFLTTFGRASRDTVSSCEVNTEPTLSQALHLINGDTIQRKVREGKLIPDLLAKGTPSEKVVEEIYLRALSRKPTADEASRIKAALDANAEHAPLVLEDVFWAILNSKEFVFNH